MSKCSSEWNLSFKKYYSTSFGVQLMFFSVIGKRLHIVFWKHQIQTKWHIGQSKTVSHFLCIIKYQRQTFSRNLYFISKKVFEHKTYCICHNKCIPIYTDIKLQHWNETHKSIFFKMNDEWVNKLKLISNMM